MSEPSAIERFDAAIDALFDQIRGVPAFDRLFYTASELGDWSLIWHLLGALQGVLLCDGLERAVRLSAYMGIESALVNGGIKSLFRRERPIFEAERPHKLRQPLTSSFPSGHASAAFTAAALLSDGTRAKPLFYAIAGIVALSRIHVRIHHASDVMGGALVGLVLGALAKRFWALGDPPFGLEEWLGR